MTGTPTTNYGFLKPIPGADLGTWGVTLNQSLDAIDGKIFEKADSLNVNGLTLANNPGTPTKATLTFINGTAPALQQTRWVLAEDTSTEGGGNSGSNLSLTAYSDTGTVLSTPIVISRSTGAITFGTPVSYPAGMTLSTLNVTGAATFTTASFSDTATFAAANFSGAVTAGAVTSNGALNVAGAAALSSTLAVAGAATSASLAIGHSNDPTAGTSNVAGLGFSVSGGMVIETSSGNANLLCNRIGSAGGVQSFRQSNTICGSITVATNACAFNTTSDERLKTDAQPFDAGPILDATVVYDFAWEADGTRAYGVMAQEANTVFPEAVHHDEVEDTWGVDYSKYVPLLLNEIKALRARVAALEAKL